MVSVKKGREKRGEREREKDSECSLEKKQGLTADKKRERSQVSEKDTKIRGEFES